MHLHMPRDLGSWPVQTRPSRRMCQSNLVLGVLQALKCIELLIRGNHYCQQQLLEAVAPGGPHMQMPALQASASCIDKCVTKTIDHHK